MNDKQIKTKLKQLLKNAYAPYSRVQVSAILVTQNKGEYSGVNVENASYGATICAERSALVMAVANGVRGHEICAIHIYSNLKKALYPCALCLQMMVEFFNSDVTIHIHDGQGVIVKTIDELVPYKVTKHSF